MDVWLSEAYRLIDETINMVASHRPSRYDSETFQTFADEVEAAIKKRSMGRLGIVCGQYQLGQRSLLGAMRRK